MCGGIQYITALQMQQFVESAGAGIDICYKYRPRIYKQRAAIISGLYPVQPGPADVHKAVARWYNCGVRRPHIYRRRHDICRNYCRIANCAGTIGT
jgi:hypothetical protein